MSDPDLLTFNGINGRTGEYLLPAMSPEALAKLAQGDVVDPAYLAELKHRVATEGANWGVREGVDATKLEEAGWGVVFASDDADKVDQYREALQPLLTLRQHQAGERYREFTGADAYKAGESKSKFLARHGMGPGAADPDKVPYYLLIVADPESIPFRLQFQLDVDYAVGRIHFDELGDYANYAKSVVAAERGAHKRSRALQLFGVENPGDRATQMSTRHLIEPLAKALADRDLDWSIETCAKDDATKAGLRALLSGEDPAVLFTASHGMGFPNGDPLQLDHQGALLCRDWPGPLKWLGKPIPPEFYLSAEDLDDAAVGGLVVFHFACYGAGTPLLDDFAHQAFKERIDIAPHPFVAKLPKRMLSDPDGGALAVVGHVERAWGYSFTWPGAGEQVASFEDTFIRLIKGHPIGHAMEFFDDRYASIATELNIELEDVKFGKPPDERMLAGLWTANNDAKSYVIIGDPAVRVNV